MDARIAEFTALLRENGLRISIAEHLDAFRALERLGVEDPQVCKDVLRAAMVKRAVDIETFDELFDLYFSGLGRAVKRSAEVLRGSMKMSEAEFQQLIEQLEAILQELGVELSPLAQALLRNDTGRLEQMLRQAAGQAGVGNIERPFQEGRYTHGTAQAIGLAGLTQEMDQLKEALGGGALPSDVEEALRRFIDQRLQNLTDLVKRTVRLELEQKDPAQRERDRLSSLSEKSFYYLSEDEIRRMKEAVTRLAQRLKNVVAVRHRRAKRGKFDCKATLRRSLQYGGVPFKIRFDRRVKDKPQVVILCDVSDSVRNVSRFMLQFVYSLQDLYSRVRSFVFVSEIGEITRLFEEREINDAIEEALTGDVINVFAHSDFGRAFRTFHRDYLSILTKKTTVIILGDARNNYNLPHEWTLKDMRARSKQIIWLNPESRLTWGFGDSEMDRYMPHCHMVEECRNLNQLYRVVDRLVH